jgi:hypothetical protein
MNTPNLTSYLGGFAPASLAAGLAILASLDASGGQTAVLPPAPVPMVARSAVTNQPVVISMTTAPGTFQGQSNYVFSVALNAKDVLSPSLTNYNTWSDNTSLAGGEYHPEGSGTLTVTDGSGNQYACGLTNIYFLFSNTEIMYLNQYGMVGAGAEIVPNPTNDWMLTNNAGVSGSLSSFLPNMWFWSPVPVRSFKKPWLSQTNLSKWEGLSATFSTGSESIDEYQTSPVVSIVFPEPVVERQLLITTSNTNVTSKLYGKNSLTEAWQLISSNPPPWRLPVTNATGFYSLGE